MPAFSPIKRRVQAPLNRKRMVPATVLVGWTKTGRPVSSLPLRNPEAIQNRIRTWKRKGYKVSSLIEWDFV